MRWPTIAASALAACAAVAGIPLTVDPPPVRPPTAGDVKGAIVPVDRIGRLTLVSRVTGQSYSPAELDRATGRFLFKDLPGDARYDLCLTTADGRSIEGIDLDFIDARMLRLAEQRRKDLGLPPEPAHEFTGRDVEELLTHVRDMEDFMDLRRVLYIQGHGKRATMLLELMRTREHYDGQGRYIWRVELWYFEHHYGGWEKLKNQERILRRERIDPAAWAKIGVEYYPELSVYVEPTGYAKPVEFRIPDRPDPSRGRPAGTEPELPVETHVLGVAGPAQPATAPASPSAE